MFSCMPLVATQHFRVKRTRVKLLFDVDVLWLYPTCTLVPMMVCFLVLASPKKADFEKVSQIWRVQKKADFEKVSQIWRVQKIRDFKFWLLAYFVILFKIATH